MIKFVFLNKTRNRNSDGYKFVFRIKNDTQNQQIASEYTLIMKTEGYLSATDFKSKKGI